MFRGFLSLRLCLSLVRFIARNQIVCQAFGDFCGRADGPYLATDSICSRQRNVDEVRHLKQGRERLRARQLQTRLPRPWSGRP